MESAWKLRWCWWAGLGWRSGAGVCWKPLVVENLIHRWHERHDPEGAYLTRMRAIAQASLVSQTTQRKER